MLHIANNVSIPEQEIEFKFIRAQGAGGQNVNKVSSAVHLRFNVTTSSLPEEVKQRVLALHDRRLSKDGVIVIKAQQHRSQEKNREEALQRLLELVRRAMQRRKKRRPTGPSKAARKKRMDNKKQRGQLKSSRRKVNY